MRGNHQLLVLLLALTGCDPSGKPPSPTGGAIPDGDAVEDAPVDPAVEAEQRRLAKIEDPGIELGAVPVTTPDELQSAGLRTFDRAGAPFLQVIVETLLAGLEDSTFILLFDPQRAGSRAPDIRGADGTPLVAIEGIDREVPACTTWGSVDLQGGEDEVGFGARMCSNPRSTHWKHSEQESRKTEMAPMLM